MNATTVAIDLAKDVFELAYADRHGRILGRKRLSRRAFARCLENGPALEVVMEACGSAHYWARRFQRQGHQVRLLPARDVRRNKPSRWRTNLRGGYGPSTTTAPPSIHATPAKSHTRTNRQITARRAPRSLS